MDTKDTKDKERWMTNGPMFCVSTVLCPLLSFVPFVVLCAA